MLKKGIFLNKFIILANLMRRCSVKLVKLQEKNVSGSREDKSKIKILPSEKCENCGELFFKSYIRWHRLRVHVDDTTVKTCQGCGGTFFEARLLQFHLRDNPECLSLHSTGRSRPGVYSCDECGLVFQKAEQQELVEHVRRMHPEEELQLMKCRLCDKKFFHEILLKAHYGGKHADDVVRLVDLLGDDGKI